MLRLPVFRIRSSRNAHLRRRTHTTITITVFFLGSSLTPERGGPFRRGALSCFRLPVFRASLSSRGRSLSVVTLEISFSRMQQTCIRVNVVYSSGFCVGSGSQLTVFLIMRIGRLVLYCPGGVGSQMDVTPIIFISYLESQTSTIDIENFHSKL